MASEVRIIGGKWKGRKVRFDAVDGLRPSLGRARETLFNWLSPQIEGKRCLDLFAGSGALGLEALSRGAEEVIFVDRNPRVCTRLRDQLRSLNTSMPVHRSDATAYLRRYIQKSAPEPVVPFDLIFADPPFDGGFLAPILKRVWEQDLLSIYGHIYFECRRGSESQWGNWTLTHHSRAGDTQFGLLARPS